MDRDWKKEIQAAASLKPARKAFDALWKIRIDLAGIGDFGLRLGEMEEWENALFLVDQNLVMHHAKPFYDAGGNPPRGYADRFIGREEDAHVICNKTGTSSSVTNAQLGAFASWCRTLSTKYIGLVIRTATWTLFIISGAVQYLRVIWFDGNKV